MLQANGPHPLQDPEEVEKLESYMLTLRQVECPVVHHFGPGIYIREVTIPAGTLAVGHSQKFDHLNLLLRGTVAIIGEDGQPRVLKAPLIFVGKPGRKIGYAVEDTVWQNIYATEERDIAKLEETFLNKSDTWESYRESMLAFERLARSDDRDDFEALVKEAGYTLDEVKRQAENESDLFLTDSPQISVRESGIEGKGLFASAPFEPGDYIAPGRVGGLRTTAGRYTNHSMNPNARFVEDGNGDYSLVATKFIRGCQGGDPGEEITVNYRESPAFRYKGAQL